MEQQRDNSIECIRKLIAESNRIVAICGIGMNLESGGRNLWSPDDLNLIETKYGRSPEEILSAGMYSTKKEHFYDFYRSEFLDTNLQPNAAHLALKRLETIGKLQKTITLNVHGLEKKAGISHLVELCGSIYDNTCQKCGQQYDVTYLQYSKGVPLCSECKTAIRPNIRLFGEKVRNDLLTESVNACAHADLILVLGTNLYGHKVRYCTEHYDGNRLVLVSLKEHFTDKYADYVIHQKVSDVLPQL